MLLCDLKKDTNDTIEVTLVSLSNQIRHTSIFYLILLHLQSIISDDNEHAIAEGVRVLGEHISRKQSNLSILAAVVEVKVETAVISEGSSASGYLVALVCVAVAGLAAAGGAALYCLQQRRRARSMSNLPLPASGETCHRHHDDEKSNNLQNEENFRRYYTHVQCSFVYLLNHNVFIFIDMLIR